MGGASALLEPIGLMLEKFVELRLESERWTDEGALASVKPG